jgi:hypothetical protein
VGTQVGAPFLRGPLSGEKDFVMAGDERNPDVELLGALFEEELARGLTPEQARQRALARIRDELARRQRTLH